MYYYSSEGNTNNATAAVVAVAAASCCYDLICIHMVEIQTKRYDTIQQSLGPASNLHAPGSRCPPSLPPSLPPGGCDIIDLRITCALRLSIHTYMSHVFDSVRIPGWSCSHGALSGVWMLLLLRRCSRDAQILAAGAA